jgi:hypothetical protein
VKKKSSLALAFLTLFPSLSWAWSGEVVGVTARRKGLFTSEMRPSVFPEALRSESLLESPTCGGPKKRTPPTDLGEYR